MSVAFIPPCQRANYAIMPDWRDSGSFGRTRDASVIGCRRGMTCPNRQLSAVPPVSSTIQSLPASGS